MSITERGRWLGLITIPVLTAALLGCPDPGVAVEPAGDTPTAAPFDHTHTAWTSLLAKYLDAGSVDYAGLKADGQADLEAYLDALESVTKQAYEGFSEAEQLAFWINAYNAYTVQLVLENHPIESIRDLGNVIDRYVAFKKEFIPLTRLEGDDLSLNDIEHEILRKRYTEPRIHFAIVCASKSCPVLHEEAFRGADLETQLTLATKRFLADEFRNRVDADGKTLAVSKIFDWFAEDFEKASGSVPAFIAGYAPDAMAALARRPDAEVDHLTYDWSLNGT